MFSQEESVQEEFETLTTSAGLVRGVFGAMDLGGPESLDLIHRLSTNDIRGLQPGTAAWTVFTDEKGRIVDLCVVVPMQDRVRVFCSEGNESRLAGWISRFIITEEIVITELTPGAICVCLIGPQAISRLVAGGLIPSAAPASGASVYSIGNEQLVVLGGQHFAGVISLWIGSGEAQSVKYLSERGAPWISQQGYHAYRIFRGMPAFGHEITTAFNPHEVRLRSVISFTKGCYVGQEVIARLETYAKVRRQLVGLLIESGKASIQNGTKMFSTTGEVGVVTSVSSVRINGYWRALAVAQTNLVGDGMMVELGGPGGVAARVVLFLEGEERS